MPPRTAPRPISVPEWNALLLRSSSMGSQGARRKAVSPPRAQRPSTLLEAIVRFVDRNWD